MYCCRLCRVNLCFNNLFRFSYFGNLAGASPRRVDAGLGSGRVLLLADSLKCFFLNLGGFIVTDAMFKGLVIAVVPDSSHLTRLSSLGGE